MTDPDIETAKQVAHQWLAFVDAFDYEGSWAQTATRFRQSITSADWASRLRLGRTALGPLTSRNLAVAQRVRDVPDAPPGEYIQLQYHSIYDQTKAMVETVALAREDDQWRVTGHFVR